ncbi:phospho-acceptor domain-containing protein [Neorhizobium sp. R1-B]|nr:phospho-acceptor domain-containing protein [Neorhizobium sp. S3-V5DH]TDX84996.1 phospho-acceptor domain-containing protein [Neorhizobium sp. R1-B]
MTFHDLSPLARLESELADQTARLDEAINNMPHGLCMFDSEKNLIVCNAAYAAMYHLPEGLTRPGTPLDSILEHRELRGIGPLDKAAYFDVVTAANVIGSVASQNIVLSDGRVIKITHNPMKTGGYVATHEDVTAAVAVSEELIRQRDMLEAAVQARTAEIERQARELERMLAQERQINELQRQFVAMASHEFRTPLTIIDGAAQRLFRRRGQLDSEFVTDKIDRIRGAVSRIVELMESILAVGRLDHGSVEMSHEPLSLRELIRTCCDRQQSIAADHRIHTDLGRLPDQIEGDRRALEQVFTNLLSNAVKYAPSAPDVHVAGWKDAAGIKIAVRDGGLGIDAEDLPRMFQKYFRARTSSGIAGTGIGLNLIKQIIELHGGTVEVASKKGHGSTFTITLPLEMERAAADTAIRTERNSIAVGDLRGAAELCR